MVVCALIVIGLIDNVQTNVQDIATGVVTDQ